MADARCRGAIESSNSETKLLLLLSHSVAFHNLLIVFLIKLIIDGQMTPS
jgi:hypothetical protein